MKKYSRAVGALALFCFVYVMGFGAAVRLSVQNSRTTRYVDFLYEPIFWLRDEVPAFRKLTGWYMDFCIYYHTDSERNGD